MNNQPTAGTLYLVATPIGNLGDITFRAVAVLQAADLIAAEDTRHARILCARYDIATPLVPYHAFNEHKRTAWLLDQVAAGKKVTVLSDAGTPVIADPGFLIVRAAHERGIEPVVVPGVSALTFAVVACGMPVDRFGFFGFPPVKAGRRRTFLAEIAATGLTAFVFEGPHRIDKLLGEIAEVMGETTPVALIREATKLHEQCLRGPVAALRQAAAGTTWRGEFVVAINTRAATVPPAAETEARRTRKNRRPAKSPIPVAQPESE